MTHEELRKIDAEIAEKVMGLELYQPKGTGYIADTWVYAINDFDENGPRYVNDSAPYSSDISAAWEVVEKLQGHGMTYQAESARGWLSPSIEHRIRFVTGKTNDLYQWGAADNLPLAICLAALKAVG